MAEYLLAIDQGGNSTRAIAFDNDGRVLDSEQRPLATDNPRTGWFEHDAEALAHAAEQVVAAVVNRLGTGGCIGAGLATQRSSIVCWDRRTGAPLSPVLSWRDRRHADWLRELGLDEPKIHAVTGLRISAHYGASKLRWCLDHLPAVRAALDDGHLAWGPLASFLIFRLTRERTLAADPCNASRTLLWDLSSRDWSEALLHAFGLPREPLPSSTAEDGDFGHLHAGDGSIPLLRCTGDQSAALHSRGRPDDDRAYVNVGTGGFALRRAPWPNPERRLLTSIVRGDAEGLVFALEGTVNGAASALDAEGNALGVDDWKKALATTPPADAVIPTFLNGHSGLGAPWWIDRFPSRYCTDAAPELKLAAVMESIVFMLAENLTRAAQYGAPLRQIVISGGLSRMPALCQRLADICGIPVFRPEVTEGTARGLAWLCAGRDAPWPDAGPGTGFSVTRDPGLDARHEAWRTAMREAVERLAV
jgi:glycerol kinase